MAEPGSERSRSDRIQDPARTSTLDSTRSRSRSPAGRRHSSNRSSFYLRFRDPSESSGLEEFSSSSDEDNQGTTISYAQTLPRSPNDDAIFLRGNAFTSIDTRGIVLVHARTHAHARARTHAYGEANEKCNKPDKFGLGRLTKSEIPCATLGM